MTRVTATLKNDIRKTSITVHGMGPDRNTLYVTKELSRIIFDVLFGFDKPYQPGYLGTHGRQEWSIEFADTLDDPKKPIAILHRNINEEKTA